jgi:hypothetical protein
MTPTQRDILYGLLTTLAILIVVFGFFTWMYYDAGLLK